MKGLASVVFRRDVSGCVKRLWHGIYYAIAEARFGCFDATVTGFRRRFCGFTRSLRGRSPNQSTFRSHGGSPNESTFSFITRSGEALIIQPFRHLIFLISISNGSFSSGQPFQKRALENK
jgi:hypothetical protein